MFTCSTCCKEWSENYCPECAQTIDRALLDEDLDTGGEVIRDTWASRAAKVKLSTFRYLWLKQEPRTVVTFLFIVSSMLLGAITLEWWVMAALLAFMFIALVALLAIIARQMKVLYANAALTAGLVVSEAPLEFISLANMDTGAGEEAYAVKRVALDRLPCHPHTVGTEFPCVSGFQAGLEEERWGDFNPQPLSFGTGDMLVIQARANKLGPEAFAQLREVFRTGAYPPRARELLWLNDRGRTQPPPLPHLASPLPQQPPPLPRGSSNQAGEA